MAASRTGRRIWRGFVGWSPRRLREKLFGSAVLNSAITPPPSGVFA
ncbi:hypothetical protein P186_2035 [Pyrobaculum ferrireducens]|uniref:Uncharacterized protein n=1 Tax=Pyrobaculum ferrireducens TaxID=1104324 RepID=G7VIF2_9CREN|nr:hypothetical protein P186_2035 [Pyrobaculum ferrireducens]